MKLGKIDKEARNNIGILTRKRMAMATEQTGGILEYFHVPENE